MIKQLTLAALEQTVNQLLAWDPLINESMQPLDGTVVAIAISDLDLIGYVAFDEGQIALQSHLMGLPDLTVRGALSAFVKMGLKRHSEALPTGIEILGDAALAQRLQHFLACANIDWEEIIAQLSGDFIATRLGNLFRYGRRQMTRNREEVCRNTTEFLQYEQQILPSRQDVDQFCHQVDRLRHDAARLEARISRLLIQQCETD